MGKLYFYAIKLFAVIVRMFIIESNWDKPESSPRYSDLLLKSYLLKAKNNKLVFESYIIVTRVVYSQRD